MNYRTDVPIDLNLDVSQKSLGAPRANSAHEECPRSLNPPMQLLHNDV